ncbi:MAG TPA: glycosyl transferase [Casimicrobiaceae bacterium]|nr:glycosyl transferase [Casimicrobiaceae bacterium]
MTRATVVAPALALLLAAAGVLLLSRARAALPRDVPKARSLHTFAIPRAGGFAVWLGFLPASLAFPPDFPLGAVGWLPPFAALLVVSALDDAKEVAIVTRLGVHALAALWAAFVIVRFGTPKDMTTFVAACTIAGVALAIAWSSNLYNFMDGTDGLAGTMGAIGFAAYGLAALGGDGAGARSAPAFFALVAAMLPFLVVNRPRATMFLGDVGAVPLGFLAAAFGAAGVVEGIWRPWFPLLVFLPFITDATLTLLRRILQRERFWEGHRSHHYQRLAQLGAGHGGTLAVYAPLMLGTASTAVWCRAWAPRTGWWALAFWCGVVLMLFAAIDYHWRKKTQTVAPISVKGRPERKSAPKRATRRESQ